MADINQLFSALQKADAAGNTEDAKQIAGMIRQVGGYSMPEAPPADTGFTGAFKASKENLLADYERLKGKIGISDIGEAEKAAQEHEAKAGQVFKPTEKDWTEAPWEKFKELAGGSLPYMALPVAAGIGAAALPEVSLLGGALGTADIAAGLAGTAQFTGSNLSRQVQEGTPLEQTSLLKAGAAAVPQAALDVFGMHMIPGIRGIFSKAGVEITEEQAAKLAQRGLLEKAGSFALQTGKTMSAEGLNEAGQQVFERLQAGLSITDPEARQEYYDNFLGGAILGGALGGVGHLTETKRVVPNVQPPAQEQGVIVPPAGQQAFNVEGLQPVAGPQPQAPAQADPQRIAQLRDQYDTIEREMDRLKALHDLEESPEAKQDILNQAQKLDFARQELQSQLEGAPARPAAPEGQATLDFNQPYPKSRLAGEPPIIGQQAAPAAQPNLDLEFAKQRLAAGAPLTPAQELLVRQDQAAQRTAQQTAPAPQLEIPNVVGASARPTSYVVDDSAIDSFGVTKGATKFKDAVRGLDLMNPDDAAKFDKLVEQHERKNAKINMDAVEAFKAEKPEPVAAREVPEKAGLPAQPYDARKAYQQAREAQFAFGQVAAPLSPRDIRAQAEAQNEARTGVRPVGGVDERGVPMPSAGVQTPGGVAAPESGGLGDVVRPTEQPNGRTAPSGETGNAALAQMAQQVAPATKEAIPQKAVPRVEFKEALEDRLAKEEVSPETEELMRQLGIAKAQRANLQGGTTQELQDKVFQGNTKGALQAILNDKTGQFTPLDKEVASRLLQSKSLPKIELVEQSVISDGAPAQYNPNTDTVQIVRGQVDSHTVLHETVHGFMHVMIADSEAREAKGFQPNPMLNNLRAVYDTVKDNPALLEQYGLKNLSEFTSEAFSNPEFQVALAKIPYKRMNVFSAFGRAVLKALGIKVEGNVAQTDALTATLIAAEHIMTHGRNVQTAVGARAGISPVQTGSNAFQKWFNDSVVINEDGSPMVLYHGTTKDFNQFKLSPSGALGAGIYMTPNTEFAAQYASSENGNVMPVYAKITNPLVIKTVKGPSGQSDPMVSALVTLGVDRAKAEKIVEKAYEEKGYITKEVMARAQKQGYDGIFQYMNGDLAEVLAFSPYQIKSAIGNEGTYSPGTANIAKLERLTKLEATPNVGRSIKEAVKAMHDVNKGDFWEKFRVAVVDPASALGKRLSSLPVFSNGQLRADMLHHQYAQVNNIVNNGIQSGIPVLNKDGSVTIQTTNDNLARSATLSNALNNNPNVKAQGMSGMEYVAEIARIKRGQEIMAEDSARRVAAASMMQAAEKKRKDARKKGVTGAQAIKLNNEAKALEAKYKDDVNLNREKQVTDEHVAWANAQMKAVPEVQAILDIWKKVNESLIKLREDAGLISKELADDLRKNNSYVPLFAAEEDLEAMRNPMVAITGTGAKNVSQLHKLHGSELTRNIWENLYKQYAITTAAAFQNQVRKVGISQLASLDAAEVTQNPNDPRINVRYRDANSPLADSQGIVNAMVDNPNDLAAFQMMHYELTPIMKGMAASTKLLRAGALINPVYWVKQLVRDPLHASVVGQYVVTPVDSIREYLNILGGRSNEAKVLARHGAFGAVDSTVDLQTFLKGIGTQKTEATKMDAVLHKIMQMHEASDAATRVAIYKKAYADAIRKGMDKEAAESYGVLKARESANFSVHGNSQTLNSIRQMIPFFSASITSLDTVYRAMSGHNLNPEEKALAKKMFYSRAAMMMAMTMAYAMLLQSDPDYQKLPDDVKDANWLMPNPMGNGHSFVKVPVPFEVGFLFKTIPEAVVRYMNGNSTGKEVLASYGSGVMQNLPGNGVIIPQIAKPALETITNHSFFTGRSIESMSDQNLPVSKRGQNASETSKILSNLGLDKIGLSPAKIDNIIQGYTAQLGAYAVNAADAMVLAAEGKTPASKNIEDMPGFKSIMTNPNISKAVGEFYQLQHEAVEANTEFNKLKSTGDREGMIGFLADERNKKLIMSEPALRKIQTQLANIQKQAQLIKNNEKIDPDVRMQRYNQMMTMYDKVAQQMNKVLAATKLEK